MRDKRGGMWLLTDPGGGTFHGPAESERGGRARGFRATRRECAVQLPDGRGLACGEALNHHHHHHCPVTRPPPPPLACPLFSEYLPVTLLAWFWDIIQSRIRFFFNLFYFAQSGNWKKSCKEPGSRAANVLINGYLHHLRNVVSRIKQGQDVCLLLHACWIAVKYT